MAIRESVTNTDDALSPDGASPRTMYDRPTLETYGTVHEQTQTHYEGSQQPEWFDD